MARTRSRTQADHMLSLCDASALCASSSTAAAAAADEQDILSMLLHNSSISWHHEAACKLLCTSKAMHAAVTQHLYGSLAVSKTCNNIDECRFFCMWLRKHAKLLHTLHVDLPRYEEEFEITYNQPVCASCSGFDKADSRYDLVSSAADTGLSATLFLAAPPSDPPPTNNCCCQQPADSAAADGGIMDDFDSEACPICRGYVLPRRSNLPLRSFSTNTPCPGVLSVLPASLESLEVSFSFDDLRWSETNDDYATPAAIGTAMLGLHGLQRLSLHIHRTEEESCIISGCDVIDDAVPGAATFHGVGPAADQFPSLKHLSIYKLSDERYLQLLPAQLTSLVVGFNSVPTRRRDRPRLFQDILGLPTFPDPLAAADSNPNQPAISLGHFSAMQQLTIRDNHADDDNRAAKPWLWKMLQHDDVLPPKLEALELPYGGALQPLQALPHLTRLTIEHCTMDEEQLPALNSLAGLQHLRLSFDNASSTSAAGEAWSKVAALKELSLELAGPRALEKDFSGNWPAVRPQIQLHCDAGIDGLSSVTRLELSGLSASSEGMQQMFGGGHLRQMRELRLVRFTPEDEQGVLSIGHLQAFTQLSRLELAETQSMSDALLLQVPAHLPGLRQFAVSPYESS